MDQPTPSPLLPSPLERLRRALRERLGSLRHLPALFRLVWAASPALTAASIGLRLVRAVLPVLMLYVAKLILDAVVGARGSAEPSGALITDIGLLIALECGLAIGSDLLGRATSLVDGILAELSGNAITLRLMDHAATLDLEQFEDSRIQDGLERARRQVAWRSSLLSQVFGQAQDALTVATLALALVAYLPWLILLLVLALIPAFLNELHFNRRGYRLAYQRSPERREIDYLRYLGAGVENAKEVKLFGLNGYLTDRFRHLSARILVENRELAIGRAAWGGFFAALGTLAYYAAYAVIVWRTVAGAFTIGDLTFLAGSFLRLRGLIEGLLLGLSQVSGQAQYLDDLFSFFDVAPRIRSPAQPIPFPQPVRDGFVFEDVGFRYPDQETWAVRHLDLAIRAGEVVALVGENGAGKTTLVKLLARLYEPTEGRILLDGHDLRDYDLDQLRSRIGVIFQDFVRFDFTAADNIAVGRIGDRGDRERVRRAAGQSLADGVVSRLAGGYDQLLGRRFEEGVDLSGGEWQKIAIARAYMREADILVLDEPTAALDARAEFEVFERFRELSRGRTALLISHRFSTVRIADRILVLEGGRVAESGSHVELLALRGRYAGLFELQAAGYR